MINECIGLLCMGDIYTQSLYLAYNTAVTAAAPSCSKRCEAQLWICRSVLNY